MCDAISVPPRGYSRNEAKELTTECPEKRQRHDGLEDVKMPAVTVLQYLPFPATEDVVMSAQ